jgi:serine/threonine protein kinase
MCDRGESRAQVGPPIYIAPETYAHYTLAIDVDAFTLILYEFLVVELVFPPMLALSALITKVHEHLLNFLGRKR